MFHKGEKEKCFAYNINTACDDSNFILGYEVTPGNVHDSVAFENIYETVYKGFGNEMEIVAVDAGYITPYNCKKNNRWGRTTCNAL